MNNPVSGQQKKTYGAEIFSERCLGCRHTKSSPQDSATPGGNSLHQRKSSGWLTNGEGCKSEKMEVDILLALLYFELNILNCTDTTIVVTNMTFTMATVFPLNKIWLLLLQLRRLREYPPPPLIGSSFFHSPSRCSSQRTSVALLLPYPHNCAPYLRNAVIRTNKN